MPDKPRPMLSTDEQIDHLISKGVRFKRISLDEARKYLRENNNYFKLRAYRKNFDKHPGGENEGKYINLDFAMLKDLAIIDMRMRYIFLQMVLDVEHFAKVKLLNLINQHNEDGYQIVSDYCKENNIDAEMNRAQSNPYCGGIIQKYNKHFPVWAFIEVVPFGTTMRFYGFCAQRFNDGDMKNEYYLLQTIRQLRNACAHSNCLIHNMGTKDAKHRTSYKVLRALNEIPKSKRKSQLGNECMRQIVTLLYAHSIFVPDGGVRKRVKDGLNELVRRMYVHFDYYEENSNICAFFGFFKKSVDILFS